MQVKSVAKNNVHLQTECSRAQGGPRPWARWDLSAPFSWQPIDCNTDRPLLSFPFSGAAGPTAQMPDDNTPLDFFKPLFDDTIIDLIVAETNRYVADTKNS